MPKVLLNSKVQIKVTPSVPRIIATIPVGKQVGRIVINQATNRIYFTNQDENILGVLDGTTNKVITTVKTGRMPGDVVVNPRTNRIYVTNWLDGSVTVINGRTNQIIKTIKLGERSDETAINTRTNLIYVVSISLSSNISTITIINGKTNTIMKRMPIKGRPATFVIDEVTNRIYFTDVRNDTVSIVDGNKHVIINTLKVGRNPVITPVLNKRNNCLYIPNNLSRYCSILNLRTNTIQNLQLGRLQSDININPVTNRIYITSAQESSKGRLYVIDGSTNRIKQTMTIPTYSTFFIIPNTNHLYHLEYVDFRPDPLNVYDGSTLKRITTLRTADYEGGIAVNPITNRIYIGQEKNIVVIQD